MRALRRRKSAFRRQGRSRPAAHEVTEVEKNNTDLTYEIQLAAEARAGSKEAFCKLYGIYKDKLYRYALYRLGCPQDAEDAVSECVLAAWKGIPQLKSAEAFGAWIFRILHNCCVRQIRESVSLRENMQNIYEAGSVTADNGSAAQSSAELKEALDCLGAEDREIVLLSVVGGLTSREISDITGLRPGSVRSRLSRSLARMREQLS